MPEQWLENIKIDLRNKDRPVIELDPDMSDRIYKSLCCAWMGSHRPNLIKRFLNPKWRASSLRSTLNNYTKEILPSSSNVNFLVLFATNRIAPTECLFISGGMCLMPYEIVLSKYLLAHQDEFWLPGSDRGDIGLFDESLLWIMDVGDDGQVFIAKHGE